MLSLELIPGVAFYLMRDGDLMMAGLLKLEPRAWVTNVTESVA